MRLPRVGGAPPGATVSFLYYTNWAILWMPNWQSGEAILVKLDRLHKIAIEGLYGFFSIVINGRWERDPT
jgi:hypothetical protein